MQNSIFGAFTCFNFCSNHGAACFENFETVLKMFTKKFLWHYYTGLHFRVHRVWFCFKACHTRLHEREKSCQFQFKNPLTRGREISLQLKIFGVGAHVIQWTRYATQNSCFWAHVEEASKDLENVQQMAIPESRKIRVKLARMLSALPSTLEEAKEKDQGCWIPSQNNMDMELHCD